VSAFGMTTSEQQAFSQDTTQILTQRQVEAHKFTCLFYLLYMEKKTIKKPNN
jgi:hypothetical protein